MRRGRLRIRRHRNTPQLHGGSIDRLNIISSSEEMRWMARKAHPRQKTRAQTARGSGIFEATGAASDRADPQPGRIYRPEVRRHFAQARPHVVDAGRDRAERRDLLDAGSHERQPSARGDIRPGSIDARRIPQAGSTNPRADWLVRRRFTATSHWGGSVRVTSRVPWRSTSSQRITFHAACRRAAQPPNQGRETSAARAAAPGPQTRTSRFVYPGCGCTPTRVGTRPTAAK